MTRSNLMTIAVGIAITAAITLSSIAAFAGQPAQVNCDVTTFSQSKATVGSSRIRSQSKTKSVILADTVSEAKALMTELLAGSESVSEFTCADGPNKSVFQVNTQP